MNSSWVLLSWDDAGLLNRIRKAAVRSRAAMQSSTCESRCSFGRFWCFRCDRWTCRSESPHGDWLWSSSVTCGLSLASLVRRVTVLRQQAADNLQETDKLDRWTQWWHSRLDDTTTTGGRDEWAKAVRMIQNGSLFTWTKLLMWDSD